MNLRPANSNLPGYSPERDLLYVLPKVGRMVAYNITENPDSDSFTWARKNGATDDDISKAVIALARYWRESFRQGDEAEEVLLKAGWQDVPMAARMAITYELSTTIFGMFYAYARESTMQGEDPPFDHEAVVEACVSLSSRVSKKTLFKRRVKKVVQRIKGMFTRDNANKDRLINKYLNREPVVKVNTKHTER